MKQRFSSLDLQAITGELNLALQNTRLANIYDINSRTFLLKFAKQGEKHNVLIESGYRIHLTEFARETAATPSNFCAKLRKHVRTRRITEARQLGTDRVLLLTFGGGEDHRDPEKSYHIIIEFYAGGNVILTDGFHKILSLLRVVSEDEGQKVSVGEIYDLNRRVTTEFTPISAERLTSALHVKGRAIEENEEIQDNPLQQKKKSKKDKGASSLKKVLAVNLSQYGAALIEHTILSAGLKPSDPPSILEGQAFDALLSGFRAADQLVRRCSGPVPGYIIIKHDGEHELYEDFQPFVPKQIGNEETIEVETYNGCVDKFFSSIEAQRQEQRIRTRQSLAEKRIQASKDDHQKKIDGLVSTQEVSAKKAAAIEGSQGLVDEAINAVNNLLEQGMDWLDIERLIKTEAKQGNPVADVIKLPLKLQENRITIAIPDLDDLYEEVSSSGSDGSGSDSDSSASHAIKPTDLEGAGKKLVEIDLDLVLSAYANARNYYSIRRTALTKEEKTQQASKKALRSTQQKVENDLKKNLNSERALLKPIRKVYWFEKFLWFISSEGYLVLGGHDAQQNEQLYRKHFRRGDIYVHADLNGAASVIIKNTHVDKPIPPSTLSQAGTLTVATSQAWDSKTVIGAWWVNFDQVNKTAPTGEYLTTGSFMVRGKKNFLPPAKLELGYGILWLVDEVSRDRHVKSKISDDKIEQHFAEPVEEDTDGEARLSNYESQGIPAASPPEEAKHDETLVEATKPAKEYQEPSTDGHEIEKEVTDGLSEADKYALHEHGDETAGSEVEEFSGRSKHMSAKQRKEMKKGLTEFTATSSSNNVKANHNETVPKAKPIQLTRGQKSKKKKLAKYANQDEEDLALAQQLLGVQIANDTTHDTKEVPQAVPEKPKEKKRINPEVAKLMKEENIAHLDDDEAEQITSLDIFINYPFSEDTLIDAIPTCAPYAAMARFKYKCKLQPGSTKKGKALRGVIAGWTSSKVDETKNDKEALWPREKELMKSLKDTELTSCVGVSKIKVSLGKGETATKKKSRKK